MNRIIRLTEQDLARIVRRVINEEILPNPWTDTTTALQGIADRYNIVLNASLYKTYPRKPKIYFSVKRTHTKDGAGNETDVAWRAFFGDQPLGSDKLPSNYIIDQTNLVSKENIAQRVNEYIATPISQRYSRIGKNLPTVDLTQQVNTAVLAIKNALLKAKNPTRP